MRREGFDEQIPRLGVLWTVDTSYTLFALGGLWLCASQALPFRFQLIYQLALLFGVLVMVNLAGFASQQTERLGADEMELRAGLDALRAAVRNCEQRLIGIGSGFALERASFESICETIRYLSPCDEPEARALNREITDLLGQFSAFLATGVPPQPGTTSTLDILARCQALLQLRKQQRRQ
jgi:hypothetical protein